VSFESRASSLNVPALEGSFQPPRVPPSTGLPSTIYTIHDVSTPSLPDPPSNIPSSDSLLSGQSTVGPEIGSLEAFFTAAIERSEEERVKRRSKKERVKGRSKEERVKRRSRKRRPKEERVKDRAKLLVGVAEGYSKECHDGLHKSFWSRWPPPIFGSVPEVGSEVESTTKTFEAGYTDRLRRLKQIRQGIRKGDWEASRLWLICVAHELEHISKWEGIEAYIGRGVDRRSAAAKIVEEHLGKWGSDLLKRCGNIVHLMTEGGPAAVLFDNGGRPSTV
jgi:hypothetical protein